MPTAAAPMSAPEIILTDVERVACDGGGGALGHPRVWLTCEKTGSIICPYCSRVYILRGSPADPAMAGGSGAAGA